MATANENDDVSGLEEIDALLEEANLKEEAVASDGIDADGLDAIEALLEEAEVDDDAVNGDIDPENDSPSAISTEQTADASKEDEDALDALLNDLDEADSEPEPADDSVNANDLDHLLDDLNDIVDESVPDASSVGMSNQDKLAVLDDLPEPEPKLGETPTPSFRGLEDDPLLEEEMDSIKKIVIGFSVINLLLLLATLGILSVGVFSKMGKTPEDALQLMEALKLADEKNMVITEDQQVLVQQMEQKVDGLGFQLEDIANQMGQMSVIMDEFESRMTNDLNRVNPSDQHTQLSTANQGGIRDTDIAALKKSLKSTQSSIGSIYTRVKKLGGGQGTLATKLTELSKNLQIIEKRLALVESYTKPVPKSETVGYRYQQNSSGYGSFP